MKAKLLTCFALGLAVCAFAAGLKDEINASQDKISQALMKKDIKTFEKLTRAGSTKDFVHVQNGQSMTYDQMLAQVKMSYGMMKTVKKVTAKNVKLTEGKDKATAITDHHFEGTVAAGEGKTSVLVVKGKTTDTYKKVNGKWLMARMEWTEMKMTMDGKPMNMGAGK